MSLRFGLLGLLSYQSMTGYDLKKTVDSTIARFWEAQTSQIYRELNYMEDLGWLSSVIKVQTEKPNKRIYSITPSGRQAFLDWLLKDGSKESHVNKSVFMMRVFFAGDHSIEENIEFLTHYKNACTTRLASLQKPASELTEIGDTRLKHPESAIYWDFTSNFEKAHFKMCIEWADECIATLEAQRAK
jgi:PadR family transcriptional regulator AphA